MLVRKGKEKKGGVIRYFLVNVTEIGFHTLFWGGVFVMSSVFLQLIGITQESGSISNREPMFLGARR